MSFGVVNQILAHLTGAKIHSGILVYENSDITTLTRKIFQLFHIGVGMYLGHFTGGCILGNPMSAVIINSNAYHL